MSKNKSNNEISFAGKTIVNLKETLTYPSEGNVRFSVQLDKNGQICEIRRSYAQIIKDPENKKRFVKITLGDRPRDLFERVKGRPFALAVSWIDSYVEKIQESKKEIVCYHSN